MIISKEEGWITGTMFKSMNNVLEITAEFPRYEFDTASQAMRADTVENSFPFNENVPKEFQLERFRNRKVRVTVELIDDKEK